MHITYMKILPNKAGTQEGDNTSQYMAVAECNKMICCISRHADHQTWGDCKQVMAGQ